MTKGLFLLFLKTNLNILLKYSLEIFLLLLVFKILVNNLKFDINKFV